MIMSVAVKSEEASRLTTATVNTEDVFVTGTDISMAERLINLSFLPVAFTTYENTNGGGLKELLL